MQLETCPAGNPVEIKISANRSYLIQRLSIILPVDVVVYRRIATWFIIICHCGITVRRFLRRLKRRNGVYPWNPVYCRVKRQLRQLSCFRQLTRNAAISKRQMHEMLSRFKNGLLQLDLPILFWETLDLSNEGNHHGNTLTGLGGLAQNNWRSYWHDCFILEILPRNFLTKNCDWKSLWLDCLQRINSSHYCFCSELKEHQNVGVNLSFKDTTDVGTWYHCFDLETKQQSSR